LVTKVELVAIDGRSRVAGSGQVLRISGAYTATLHVAAYDATGGYVAGGGGPDDFTVAGSGVRQLDRVRRKIVLDAIETDLDVQVGAATGSFGVVFR